MKIDFTALTQVLEETGYFQNYLTFGDGNLRPWDWDRTSRFLSGKGKLLWEGLLCGKPVSRPQLEKAAGKRIVQALLDRGICVVQEGKIKFDSFSLINSAGYSFFAKPNSLAEGYFGEDSKILMGLRPALAQGRALCLYSGTGAEVFGLSAVPGVDLAIEAEASMHPLITTNLELNGLAERSEVRKPGEKGANAPYDVIMARVPGFLEFGGIKFPTLTGAGKDGRAKWEELLGRCQRSLSDSGKLVFIGLFYGSKESAQVSKQIEEMFSQHGLTASMNISSKLAMELGIPIFNQTLGTAELYGKKKPRAELLGMLEKELETLGYSHVYLVKGMAWKERKGAPGNILNLSEHYYGTWLT